MKYSRVKAHTRKGTKGVKKHVRKCPGSKIRSKGLGRGLGIGQGRGPIGVPGGRSNGRGRRRNYGFMPLTGRDLFLKAKRVGFENLSGIEQNRLEYYAKQASIPASERIAGSPFLKVRKGIYGEGRQSPKDELKKVQSDIEKQREKLIHDREQKEEMKQRLRAHGFYGSHPQTGMWEPKRSETKAQRAGGDYDPEISKLLFTLTKKRK